jgi:hypothetical protein
MEKFRTFPLIPGLENRFVFQNFSKLQEWVGGNPDACTHTDQSTYYN